ncbi:MAG: hypothetical protein ACOYME_11480 [Prochlorotrichaceae cyanobacterium]
MPMTPMSGLFLALTCIAAIAGVGSVFELSYGEPQLGTTLTSVILVLSIPITALCFLVAVRSAKEES